MNIPDENNCLLLIIDIQEKLLNAVYNKDLLEKKAAAITKAANILNIPVLITEQYPKGLGETVGCIKAALDNAMYFEKTSFSALSVPELYRALLNYNKKQIFVCGIETHICVSQTANALIEAGYDVTLIKDASGSRAIEEHLSGIERMREFGTHIVTTEIVLFELLKTARHEKFKEIQALIK